jgi:hypothetical protein
VTGGAEGNIVQNLGAHETACHEVQVDLEISSNEYTLVEF